MILLGLILFFLLTALLILVTEALRHQIARSWIIAFIAALVAWLTLLLLRLFLPVSISLISWEPASLFNASLSLELNYQNWSYAFALITLCAAVIATDSARPSLESAPLTWAGSLALTGLNLIAISAKNSLTLAILWSLIDIVELVYLLRLQHWGKINQRITSIYALKTLSTLMLIFASVMAWQINIDSDFSSIPPTAGLFFLIAAGLRLGVLPMHQPYMDIPELKHGGGMLIRLTPAASALVLLGFIPAQLLTLNQSLINFITIITYLAAIFSSAMWISRKNEQEARPYWVVAFSAFAVHSAINGNAVASQVWGTAMLLSGSLLFLFDPPIRRIRFIPILGIIGFIGLPFTFAASGWSGLISPSKIPGSILMIIAHAMLLGGYLRFILRSFSNVTGLEKYARATYPLGLIIILQTIFINGLIAWPGVLTVGVWLGPFSSLLIIFLAYFFLRKIQFEKLSNQLILAKGPLRLVSSFFKSLKSVLSFDWVYGFAKVIFRQLAMLHDLLVLVFEGQSGILWSLVFVVALIFLVLNLAGIL